MLRTVNIISFDPIQELVYFVTQCAFVELDLLLFGVPFKKYNAEIFLMWRGTSPFENFLSKKCSGTGRYSSPLVHWPLKNFIQYFAEIFKNKVFEGLPSYQKMGGGMLSLWYWFYNQHINRMKWQNAIVCRNIQALTTWNSNIYSFCGIFVWLNSSTRLLLNMKLALNQKVNHENIP